MWKISEIFMTQTLQRPKILQLICEKTKIPGWRRCINWCESPNTSNPQTPPLSHHTNGAKITFTANCPFIWNPELKIKSTIHSFPACFIRPAKLLLIFVLIIELSLSSTPSPHTTPVGRHWNGKVGEEEAGNDQFGTGPGVRWYLLITKQKIISNWKRKKGGERSGKKTLSETGLILYYWFIWAAKVTAALQ